MEGGDKGGGVRSNSRELLWPLGIGRELYSAREGRAQTITRTVLCGGDQQTNIRNERVFTLAHAGPASPALAVPDLLDAPEDTHARWTGPFSARGTCIVRVFRWDLGERNRQTIRARAGTKAAETGSAHGWA